MSRNFDGAGDFVDIGDISTARFERLSTWSVLAFFRIESVANERAIIGKWTGTTGRQFLMETIKGGPPTRLRIFTNGTTRISGGLNVALDTWYLGVVTNDGTGGAGGLKMYLVGMDGTYHDDAASGQHAADGTDLTAPIRYGIKETSDDHDGDVCNGCYIDGELTKAEITEYLLNPWRATWHFEARHGLQFFHHLNGNDSPEPDRSGNGHSGTLTGTTKGDTPPHAHYGAGAVMIVAAGVAAPAGDVRPRFYHHRHHNLAA